jgi:hypothetical protein
MSTPFPQEGLAAQAKVIYTDEGHAFGTVGNVIVTFSIAEPTPGYLDHWMRTAKRLIAANGKSAALNLIDGTAKPPGDAVRTRLNQILIGLGTDFMGIACVVEGKGFVAAAKRSALSMIALVARSPTPMRIFGESLEGSVWLVSQLRSQIDTSASRLEARAIASGAEVMRHAHLTANK